MSDVPPALAARMDALVTAASPPEAYLDAAEELLRQLLGNGCATRSAALDLLTIDALVTTAFEVASAEPARVESRATAAVLRIAALGGS